MTMEAHPDSQQNAQEPTAQLDSDSALHNSIKMRGKDMSYYYAHAPRDTGETPAAMPVHKAIAKSVYAPEKAATIAIKTFQFLDDGAWAKVYLPLDNLSSISKDDVQATFAPRSFTVLVHKLQKCALEFTVALTYDEIDPEQCTAKLLKSKVLVKLRKVPKPPKEAKPVDEAESDAPPSLDAEAAEEPLAADAADMPVREAQAEPELVDAAQAVDAGLHEATLPAHDAHAGAAQVDVPDSAGSVAQAPASANAPPAAPPAEPEVTYSHWHKLRAEA